MHVIYMVMCTVHCYLQTAMAAPGTSTIATPSPATSTLSVPAASTTGSIGAPTLSGVAAPLRSKDGEVAKPSTCPGLGLGGSGLLWPYSDHTKRPAAGAGTGAEASASLRQGVAAFPREAAGWVR